MYKKWPLARISKALQYAFGGLFQNKSEERKGKQNSFSRLLDHI